MSFNLMLEMVVGWNEKVDFAVRTARATVNHTMTALISPGFRYVCNCPNDLQIVADAAAPTGFASDYFLPVIRTCVHAPAQSDVIEARSL